MEPPLARLRRRSDDPSLGCPRRQVAGPPEVWGFRGTVLAFAERDIRVQYKQAVLGVVWAVLQPLLFMVVFTLTLGRLAKVPGGGVSYAAFSLSALVPWTFLSGAVSSGANELISNAAMLRRVYFPREVPVLSAIVSSSLELRDRAGHVLHRRTVPGGARHVVLAARAVPVRAPGAPGRERLAAVRGAERLLPGLPVRAAVRDPALALRLTGRVSAVGRARPWKGLYVALNPAAGILDSFSNVLARGTPPDMALLGISVRGHRGGRVARLPPVQAARTQLRGRDLSDDAGGQLRTGQQAVPARRDGRSALRVAASRPVVDRQARAGSSARTRRARDRHAGAGGRELRGGGRGELRADRPERRGQEHGAQADRAHLVADGGHGPAPRPRGRADGGRLGRAPRAHRPREHLALRPDPRA